MSSKRKTTFEQICELLQPAPLLEPDSDDDFDTQANNIEDYKSESNENREFSGPYQSQISAFIDDPRYTGKRVSRNAVNISTFGGEHPGQTTSPLKSPKFLKARSGHNDVLDNFSQSVPRDGDLEEVEKYEDEEEEEDDDDDDDDEKEIGEVEDHGRGEDIGREFEEGDNDGTDFEEEDNDGTDFEDDGKDFEDDDDHVDDDDDDDDDFNILNENSVRELKENSNDAEHISVPSNILLEVEKGKAVKNQLVLWDSFLECRINFQKCLIAANRLPKCDKFEHFKEQGGTSFSSEMNELGKKVTNLLGKLLTTQKLLISSYSETKDVVKSRKRSYDSDEDQETDIDATSSINEKRKKLCVDDYESELAALHDQYMEFRNVTIQKWNDRTRVSYGKARHRDFSSFEQTTLQQIQHILSNRLRLILRTRQRNSVSSILGEVAEEDALPEHDAEIFDDSDFYQQMLRELIERHTHGSQDVAAVGRRWAAVQKLRLKMKRKVDTRATKGRRLRYDPHQKLTGLMAPVISPNVWSIKACRELFNSIFGKNQ